MIPHLKAQAFLLDPADQEAFNTNKASFSFDSAEELFDVLASARMGLVNADFGDQEGFFRKVALQDFAIEAVTAKIAPHLLAEIEIFFIYNEMN